jgi:hypothetical protein
MRTAVAYALAIGFVNDRESMGSADNRAGVIKEAEVVKQEWTAFSIRMFRNMSANFFCLLIRKVIEGFLHGCCFYRKNSNGCTTGTASRRACYLRTKSLCYCTAEGIYSGGQLFVVMKNV